MELFFTLFALALLTYTIGTTVRSVYLLRISARLVAASHSYTNANGVLSILVLGDSTAVGVGVKTPEESIPGRLSTRLNASVENQARSGALVAELLLQLARAQHEHYDLVLIQAGGNDIIKFRTLRESNKTMDSALSAAGKKSDRIVLLTAGRIGYAPFFPRLIAPFITMRSLHLRSLFMATAQKRNVLYVDLLGMSRVLNSDTHRYYAADMLHLTGQGYGVWFARLETELRARWPELFTVQK